MKILIIKLGAIGDVIMCLPALLALKQQLPNTKVTWVVGKAAKSILEATGLVDEFIVVDEGSLKNGAFLVKIKAILNLWRSLFWRKYDKVILAYSDPRYRFLLLSLRKCDNVVRFNRNGVDSVLRPKPGIHHTFEYTALLLGDIFPAYKKIEYPTLKLPDYTQLNTSDIHIALAVGGGGSTINQEDILRRWPINYFNELINKLTAIGFRVVLIGGDDDLSLLEQIDTHLVLNFIGKTTLLETVTLLRQCQLFIGNDAGPLHLSTLAGIPAIGLFGPTNPFEKMPFNSKNKHIWGGDFLSCRPCYDGKEYAPCKNNICMSSISVAQVINEAKNILGVEKDTN